MKTEQWKEYFDQKALTHGSSVKSSDYFDDRSFYMQREQIHRWLGPLQGKLILDAGCGVGAFSEPWVSGNEVHGIDFSEKSLEYAAKRGLKTYAGDLAKLPYSDGMFDLVVCIGVIQLIPDYRPVLAELARVTKPSGILLIQTLHRGSLQRKLLGLVEQSKKFDRMYCMAELKQAYEQQGFEATRFLKQYQPLKQVRDSGGSDLTDFLCTSFAIRGRKGAASDV